MQNLEVVEAWRSLLGIMDGFLVAYDLYTRMPLAQVAESKGCTAYAVHAQSRQVGHSPSLSRSSASIPRKQ